MPDETPPWDEFDDWRQTEDVAIATEPQADGTSARIHLFTFDDDALDWDRQAVLTEPEARDAVGLLADLFPDSAAYVHSPQEALAEQHGALEAATTEAEALDAADPILEACALHVGTPPYDDLPPGGIVPKQIADVTPLDAATVRDEIEARAWELVDDVATGE